MIDDRSEARFISDDSVAPLDRHGGAVNDAHGGIGSTVISGASNKNHGGATQPGSGGGLQTIHNRVAGKGQAAAQAQFQKLTRLCTRLGVPKKVTATCEALFESISSKGKESPRIKDKSSLVPSIVYVACRQEGMSRSLKEVAIAAQQVGIDVSKKSIGRCFLSLSSQLDVQLQAASGSQYIVRFASALQLPALLSNAAREVMTETENRGMATGRNPISIAAAALYLTCMASADAEDRRSICQLSKVALVSETVIRTAYQEILWPLRQQLMPSWYVQVQVDKGMQLEEVQAC
jgi:transcription initiation factor TFIIB